MRLVVNAEENKTRQSQAFPADPLYPNQWSLPIIGWDQVFGNVTPTGSAIAAAQTNTLEGIAGVAYAGVPIDKLLGDRARDARGSAGRERASFSTWACPRTGSAHGGFDARR